MTYKASGKVVALMKTQTFASGFSKRDVVVDVADAGSKYPSTVSFTFKKDHVSELDGIKVGQTVEVTFALDGREWTSPKGEVKYFNDLSGLKIAVGDGNASIPAQAVPPKEWQAQEAAPEDNEAMPF